MVYCDSSFIWHPDHPHTSRSTGAAILVSDTTVIDHISGGLGSYTHSQDAELQALLLGIQLLNRTPPPIYIKEVILVSDSALALQQLQLLAWKRIVTRPRIELGTFTLYM